MGQNHAEKFKDQGVSKGASFSAPPEFFTIAPRGHYLYDPTSPSTPPPWLVKSIDEFGVIQAIECVTDGDKTYVSKGRSRVLGCLAANEARAKRGDAPRRVPYNLRDKRYLTDEQLSTEIDVENVHRRHAGPVDIAERIARHGAAGVPAARIAFLAGCKPGEVASYARINALATELRDAIRDGRIAWRVAIEYDKLDREAQVAAVGAAEEAGATRGSKGRAAAREATGRNKPRGRVLPRVVLARQLEALPTSPGLNNKLGQVETARQAGLLEGFRAGLRHSTGDATAAEALPADLRSLLEEAAKPRQPGPKGKAVKG